MTTKIESTKPDANGKQTVIFQILPTHLVKERIRDVDIWESLGGPCKDQRHDLINKPKMYYLRKLLTKNDNNGLYSVEMPDIPKSSQASQLCIKVSYSTGQLPKYFLVEKGKTGKV